MVRIAASPELEGKAEGTETASVASAAAALAPPRWTTTPDPSGKTIACHRAFEVQLVVAVWRR